MHWSPSPAAETDIPRAVWFRTAAMLVPVAEAISASGRSARYRRTTTSRWRAESARSADTTADPARRYRGRPERRHRPGPVYHGPAQVGQRGVGIGQHVPPAVHGGESVLNDVFRGSQVRHQQGREPDQCRVVQLVAAPPPRGRRPAPSRRRAPGEASRPSRAAGIRSRMRAARQVLALVGSRPQPRLHGPHDRSLRAVKQRRRDGSVTLALYERALRVAPTTLRRPIAGGLTAASAGILPGPGSCGRRPRRSPGHRHDAVVGVDATGGDPLEAACLQREPEVHRLDRVSERTGPARLNMWPRSSRCTRRRPLSSGRRAGRDVRGGARDSPRRSPATSISSGTCPALARTTPSRSSSTSAASSVFPPPVTVTTKSASATCGSVAVRYPSRSAAGTPRGLRRRRSPRA